MPMNGKPKFDGEVMNITVAEHSSKLTSNGAKLIKVTDTTGKKYSFFSTKMDKSDTAAYREFAKLGDPVGKTLEVGVKSEPFEFEGKTLTRNKILFLKEVQSNGNYDRKIETPPGMIEIDSNGQDLPF